MSKTFPGWATDEFFEKLCSSVIDGWDGKNRWPSEPQDTSKQYWLNEIDSNVDDVMAEVGYRVKAKAVWYGRWDSDDYYRFDKKENIKPPVSSSRRLIFSSDS